MLCFEIFRIPIRNNNKNKFLNVGIFTVNDTNIRLLIVGFAVFDNLNSENIEQVLREFFSIQKKRPQTLITSDFKEIYDAVKYLQYSPNSFSHVINPWIVIKHISELPMLSKDYLMGLLQVSMTVQDR